SPGALLNRPAGLLSRSPEGDCNKAPGERSEPGGATNGNPGSCGTARGPAAVAGGGGANRLPSPSGHVGPASLFGVRRARGRLPPQPRGGPKPEEDTHGVHPAAPAVPARRPG